MGRLAETLPERGLVAITWSGVGLAAAFIVGRIVIRALKYHKVHHVDDCLM